MTKKIIPAYGTIPRSKNRNRLLISEATMPGILGYAQSVRDSEIPKPATLEEGILGWAMLAVWAAKFLGLERDDMLAAVGMLWDETEWAKDNTSAGPAGDPEPATPPEKGN